MSAPGSATPLTNRDFRAMLTPAHPSMTKAARTPTQAMKAAPTSSVKKEIDGGKTPMRYADGGMKTFKFSKHGLEENEDEAEDDRASSSASSHAGKSGRVLSSRERSYLQYQAKLAAKAESRHRYRDRAKERQLGLNPDYADMDETAVAAAEQASYEASKYLGGDIQHTHMVKGLDFALLNKVRQEIEKREEAKLEALMREMEEKKANVSAGPALAAAQSIAAAAPKQSTTVMLEKHPLTPAQQAATTMKFETPLAAAIYNLTFDTAATTESSTTAAPPTTDLFLPGRMCFDFPLHPPPSSHRGETSLSFARRHASDLPPATLTSRADLEHWQQTYADDHCLAMLPYALQTKIIDIFQRQRREAMERKERRKKEREEEGMSGFNVPKQDRSQQLADEQATGAGTDASAPSGPEYTVERPPPAPADDESDDEIFAGVGSDYKLKLDEKKEEEESGPVYTVERPPALPDEDEDEDEDTHMHVDSSASMAATVRGQAPIVGPARPPVAGPPPMLSDEEEDEDLLDTTAGDELLSGLDPSLRGKSAADLSASERQKLRNRMFAEAEYEELYPAAAPAYSSILDDDGDDDESGRRKKRKATDETELTAEQETKRREARFNAEFGQVTSLLKARGVQLNDDTKRRQTNKGKEVDDERAIKRQKILRGFQTPKPMSGMPRR